MVNGRTAFEGRFSAARICEYTGRYASGIRGHGEAQWANSGRAPYWNVGVPADGALNMGGGGACARYKALIRPDNQGVRSLGERDRDLPHWTRERVK